MPTNVREILERGVGGVAPPPDGYERLLRRRDRKRRNRRLSAGTLAIVLAIVSFAVLSRAFHTERPSVEPAPKPPALEDGVDARITDTKAGCSMEGVDGPIAPGIINLELVSDVEGGETYFHLVRLGPDQSIHDKRLHPGFPATTGPWAQWVGEYSEWTWSSPKEIADGRWAVVCLTNRLAGPERGGVAGPIEIASVKDSIDATVTFTGPDCVLGGVSNPIGAGILRVRAVNDSRHDGMFTAVRLAPGQTLADLRADPGSAWSNVRNWTVYVKASVTRLWSIEGERSENERWAVTCWKDVIAAPNGFQMMPIGNVGPL